MQRRQKELVAHLLDAFPPTEFRGAAVAADAPFSQEMQQTLAGCTWWAVPDAFVRERGGHLAMLSDAAYQSFLPAWLCEAVRHPDSDLARQVMGNLTGDARADTFSSQQRFAIVQLAKWLSENMPAAEPADEAIMEKIKRRWGEHGA